MRTIRSIPAMQKQALRWRREGIRIALVPTMGFLHEGHLELIRRARRKVGNPGQVVVSIFVNPAQFGPSEDFSRYPRDEKGDLELCRKEGAAAAFIPLVDAVYPGEGGAGFSTFVVEESLARSMEGASRPTHFRGVTTVVAKLFNLVLPDLAVFGAKDFQQAAVIRRMTRDLNFPIRIDVAPTVREPDGLALSSRNQYLSADERAQAPIVWKSIQTARKLVQESRAGLPATRLKSRLRRLIEKQPSAAVDYLEFFEPDTLAPVKIVKPGIHLALAVFMGGTRLIDNGRM